MFNASGMVILTPHSPEIWDCLLGRIMDHADPMAVIFCNQKPAWLLIMIWLWENLWSYFNPRDKKEKKRLLHKLISFLESTTVSYTRHLSIRQYWLTLNKKMISCIFNESPDHSKTSLSFVLLPRSYRLHLLFFEILRSPTVEKPNPCFS